MSDTINAPEQRTRTAVSTAYLADAARIDGLSISRRAKRIMLLARYAEFDVAWELAR